MIGPMPVLEVEELEPRAPVWWFTQQGTLAIARVVGPGRGGRLPWEILVLFGTHTARLTQLHIATDWLRRGGDRLRPEEGPV